MASETAQRERWKTLEQLDAWLRTPMLLLSLAWLVIVLVELLKGSSALLGMATVDDPQAFAFITMRPWREKRGAYVGPYRMGWWPAERAIVQANYENPAGFIEVTRENQDTRISEHFRLADFLTHDQHDVWPKYVVLREALLDKLELTIAELERR